MYAIDMDLKKINDVIVNTFGRTIIEHNTELEAEAGTTGYKGTPCRKGGGRTYLRFPFRDHDGR